MRKIFRYLNPIHKYLEEKQNLINENRRILEELESLKKQYKNLSEKYITDKRKTTELRDNIRNITVTNKSLKEKIKIIEKKDLIIGKIKKRLEDSTTERKEVYRQYNILYSQLYKYDGLKSVNYDSSRKSGTSSFVVTSIRSQGFRLNIGCGKIKKIGYFNVDIDPSVNPDVVLSIESLLPFKSGTFELVEAHHIIEHIFPWIVSSVLSEFLRILKPNGNLIIECPNIEFACNQLASNVGFGLDSKMGMWPIYGDPNHKNPYFMHKWGYTPLTIYEILLEAGFDNIRRESPKTHTPNRDMRIVASKACSI